MSHNGNTPQDTEGLELNDELKSLSRILEDSLFTDNSRQLDVVLCEQSTAIVANASSIRQIVINLVRNAAESLAEAGGRVEIRTSAPVWQSNRSWVELEITDTGAGIPDDVRKSLFAPAKTT